VSRRWRSELIAVLGAEHCELSVVPGLFGTRLAARSEASGGSPASIAAALQALAASGPPMLPRQARLTVPDERVYFAMLPATSAWSRRLEVAARHFAESLGRQDLHVQISLVDAGRSWLAAAIEEGDRQAWDQPFSDVGIRLRAIEPALTHDLRRIASGVPADCVLVMMRREGAMLLHVRDSEMADLRWERCVDTDVEQRVEAFVAAVQAEGTSLPVLVFSDEIASSDTLTTITTGHGWRRLRVPAARRSAELAA
jgi:hypothetical protein